jgi:hypothetical protein
MLIPRRSSSVNSRKSSRSNLTAPPPATHISTASARALAAERAIRLALASRPDRESRHQPRAENLRAPVRRDRSPAPLQGTRLPTYVVDERQVPVRLAAADPEPGAERCSWTRRPRPAPGRTGRWRHRGGPRDRAHARQADVVERDGRQLAPQAAGDERLAGRIMAAAAWSTFPITAYSTASPRWRSTAVRAASPPGSTAERPRSAPR